MDEAGVERALGIQYLLEGVEGFLPTPSVSSSTGDSTFQDLWDMDTRMWETRFSISQPVVNATTIFGLLGGIQQNGIQRAQSRQTVAKLVLDVQNAYYNLAKSQALVASAEGQYKRAEENLKLIDRRFELDDANRIEKLRAEATLLTAERELISASASLETNQRILSDLLGFEQRRPLWTDTLPDAAEPSSLSTTVISRGMLEQNPDFDLLLRQVKATDLTYWGVWASILPSINLSASRNYTQEQVLPSQWDEGRTSYGLSISFPIADLTGKALSINKARLERKKSRISLARQELTFHENLAALIAAQEASYKGWEVAVKNVELSNEVYRLTRRSFELGATSLSDLLEIEAELVQAERALVEATAAYWSSRAELNYFLGISLED